MTKSLRLWWARRSGAVFSASGGSSRRIFIAETAATSRAARAWPDFSVWIPRERWGLVPDFSGRRVAIVANRPLSGLGADIDSHDEVMRLNRMGYWRCDARDDGSRITIWAGLPKQHVLPDKSDGQCERPKPHVRFEEVECALSLIWAVTPFDTSLRFYRHLMRQNLRDKFLLSGDCNTFRERVKDECSSDLHDLLYHVTPDDPLAAGVTAENHFDLMLTGVRTVLFSVLANPRELTLFGFDFYKNSEVRPWSGHDLDVDRQILALIEQEALRRNIRFVRRGARS